MRGFYNDCTRTEMIVSDSVYHRDWLEDGGFLLPSKKNTRPQVAYLDSLRPST